MAVGSREVGTVGAWWGLASLRPTHFPSGRSREKIVSYWAIAVLVSFFSATVSAASATLLASVGMRV